MTNRGLGARHAEVQRLRALARDRHARRTEHAFLLEGPLLLDAALDRHAPLEAVYLGYGARPAFGVLLERVAATGVPIEDLREGVLEKVGTTRTPQPVLAVATMPTDPQLPPDGDVLVAVDVADPGNLGTMIRSAEAAGAAAVVVTGDSVDPHNPKAVRSTAGAIFGLPVLEDPDPAAALDTLHARGRHTIGTAATGGRAADTLDVTLPVALVVGNEAHGLAPDVQARLDDIVTIPMHGAAESLNVAMAATVLLFDLDRRRTPTRTATGPPR